MTPQHETGFSAVRAGGLFSLKAFIFFLAAFGSIVLFVSDASAQRAAGFVRAQSGTWRAGGRNIIVGSYVNAGESIRNTSGSNSDYIYISDRQGNNLAGQECSGGCQGFTVPTPSASEEGYFARAWNTLSNWAFGQRRHMRPVSRGDMLDTVVKIENGETDLTPFFNTLPAGNYNLIFVPVGRRPDASAQKAKANQKQTAQAASKPSVKHRESWNPADKKTVVLKGLTPGIYSVESINNRANSAWVLVVPSANYEKASEEFAEARRITAKWETQRSTSQTIDRFLRVYIDYLAETYLPVMEK